MIGLVVFFAGTQMQTQKDPRKAVGHDVPLMTTFYELRRMKTPKLILQLKKDRKISRLAKKKKKKKRSRQ